MLHFGDGLSLFVDIFDPVTIRRRQLLRSPSNRPAFEVVFI